MDESWEPHKKPCCFGNRGVLYRKVPSLQLYRVNQNGMSWTGQLSLSERPVIIRRSHFHGRSANSIIRLTYFLATSGPAISVSSCGDHQHRNCNHVSSVRHDVKVATLTHERTQ